jgi:metallophosphoesterase superfamily enzyme
MAYVDTYKGRIIITLGDFEHSLDLEEAMDLLEKLYTAVREQELALVYSSRDGGSDA